MEPTAVPSQPPVQLEGRNVLTAALLTGVMMASLEMAIVQAALPQIATDLRDAGLLPWCFAGFLAASTVATPVFGVLADRSGRRAAYAWGMVFLLGGSLVAALAPSMPVLLAGRVLQGVGGGALMPVTLVIFGDILPVAQRARMFGTVSLVWGASTLMGPLVGAALTDAWNWRAIFWVNLLPGALATWGVWRSLSGGAPAAPGAAWNLSGLFASRPQWVVNASGALAVAAMHGWLSHVAVWVQGVEGGGVLEAGLAVVPFTLGWTAGSQAVGRLVGRVGVGALIHAGGMLLVSGALVSWWWTFSRVGLGLVGLAMGVLATAYNLVVQELAPESRRGVATSTAIFIRNLAGTAALPVYGWLAGFRPGMVDLHGVPGLREGVQAVTAACVVVSVLAAVLCGLLLPRGFRLGAGRPVSQRS